ncbi:MAG: hypothetical protein QOJ57_1721, partial [Thermoleophilaceae bacterium]|nr:hypothetical protein [Thermoleophilaceae bacterium]
MRALLLALLICLIGLMVPSVAAAEDNARYALANGCFALAAPGGAQAGKDGAGGYKLGATPAETFRMKATALGHYLLYGKSADFLAGTPSNAVQTHPDPSDDANWQVDNAGTGRFTLWLPSQGKDLGVADGGALVLVGRGTGTIWSFERADGCAAFPEADTNAIGTPTKGASAYGEVRGM